MYQLNPELAIEGSVMTGEGMKSGAYIGCFTECKDFDNQNSSAYGKELVFETNEGQKASYLRIFERKGDGSPAKGINQIHAFMMCASLRGINNHADFLGKQVGIILQKEFYFKQDGSEGYRFHIVAFFNAQTKQTAEEVIKKQRAVQVEKILETLEDKPAKQQQRYAGGSIYNRQPGPHDHQYQGNQGGVKNRIAQHGYDAQPQQQQQNQGYQPQGQQGNQQFDDDIPF